MFLISFHISFYSHNCIASLPNDMFEGMPDLAVVSLSNNRISVLSEDVFRPIWKPKTYIELRSKYFY